MKILIMGLPGSGKSTFAKRLVEDLSELGKPAEWFNADQIREVFDDWDFTDKGRERQAERMKRFAEGAVTMGKIAVCDFVCPTQKLRNIFNADIIVWLDTISHGRYEERATTLMSRISKHFIRTVVWSATTTIIWTR